MATTYANGIATHALEIVAETAHEPGRSLPTVPRRAVIRREEIRYPRAPTKRARTGFNTNMASAAVLRSSTIAQPNTGTQLPVC